VVVASALDANFFGFGAGGGGRLFTAVGETAEYRHHITSMNQCTQRNIEI